MTKSDSILAQRRLAAGRTQADMAWAIGIAIASYQRVERGTTASLFDKKSNPPIGWLVNASIVLPNCNSFEELIPDEMREWHQLLREEPPSPDWYERPEVLERKQRWEI